jgi:drug/metabolite transporter (DMT)-like permease
MHFSTRSWYVIAALAPVLLALVTIASKGALNHISSDWFLFLMFSLTLPFLAPWRASTREFFVPRAAWKDFLGHTLCIGLAWLLYTTGVALLPAAVAVFVSRTEGIFIILLAVLFLREKFGLVLAVAAVLSFVGLALIDRGELSAGDLGSSRHGIIYVIGGALSFAAGEIFAVRALRFIAPRPLTLLRNAVLATGFLVYSLSRGASPTLSDLTAALPWALCAAVAGPVLARVIHLHCIRFIPVSHAAIMSNTEPVFGVLLGLLVFTELPTFIQHAGALLICGGVALGLIRQPVRSECPGSCGPD